MKTKMTTMLAVLGAFALAASAQDNNNNNDGPPGGTPPQRGAGGASHQHGESRGHGGFHLLPPRAAEQLKLTDDQKAQLAALETETKAKLEKILTADQMTQLKNMHPPMRQGGQGKNSGGDNSRPPGDGGNGDNPPGGPPSGDQ